jgi:hypothetical protein
VAAVNVRRTGESETRVKKTIIDDLRVFRSGKGRRLNLRSDRFDGRRERQCYLRLFAFCVLLPTRFPWSKRFQAV